MEDYYNEVESLYIARLNSLAVVPLSIPIKIITLNIFARSQESAVIHWEIYDHTTVQIGFV